MLASSVEDPAKLNYPLIASPKLDGIRFIKLNGQGLTRKLKPIRNNYVRKTLEELCPNGIDGELMAGDTFNACTSAVMSEEGEPSFTLWVFDLVLSSLSKPYSVRLKDLINTVNALDAPFVKAVPTKIINNYTELLVFEKECLARGFEGIMLRDPNGPYKCGRATKREGWLLKLKRFEDSEAIVIGFEEQMHNQNEAQVNELGYTKRSLSKVGMVQAGTLGAFIARDEKRFPGVELRIGTGKGLTAALRQEIWDNKESYVGKIITYRFQEIGTQNAPRLPIWKGFRHPDDAE
jgi:DNA ligase-1